MFTLVGEKLGGGCVIPFFSRTWTNGCRLRIFLLLLVKENEEHSSGHHHRCLSALAFAGQPMLTVCLWRLLGNVVRGTPIGHNVLGQAKSILLLTASLVYGLLSPDNGVMFELNGPCLPIFSWVLLLFGDTMRAWYGRHHEGRLAFKNL